MLDRFLLEFKIHARNIPTFYLFCTQHCHNRCSDRTVGWAIRDLNSPGLNIFRLFQMTRPVLGPTVVPALFLWNCYAVVGIVSRSVAEQQGSWVPSLRTEIFRFLSIHIRCGAYPGVCPVGTGVSFPGDKATRLCSWPTHFLSMVQSLVKHQDIFTFFCLILLWIYFVV
jgi:hypothetical protein